MTILKYDFVDDDHKRMHDALIRAGWSCGNDADPFSCCFYWHWIYYKNHEVIYFDNGLKYVYSFDSIKKEGVKNFEHKTFSEVADIIEAELKEKESTPQYQLVETYDIPKDFSHIKPGQWIRSLENVEDARLEGKWYKVKSIHENVEIKYIGMNNYNCYSNDPKSWDLSDVRDTNPDEEIKMQEEQEPIIWKQSIESSKGWHEETFNGQFPQVTALDTNDQEYYEITKNNIAEVLEYNHIEDAYLTSSIIQLDGLKGIRTVINLEHPNLISIIEAHYGKKLNPIPKPKFHFVQYLLDNGFTKNEKFNDIILTSSNGLEIKYSDRDGVWLFAGVVIKATKEYANIPIAMNILMNQLS